MTSPETTRDARPLSPAAQAWRERILGQYALDEPGLLMLGAALEAYDRAREAQALVDADGICFRDRWGQLRANPAAGIERASREQMIRCLRALGIDDPGTMSQGGTR